MKIPVEENISLKPYNTFGVDVKAKYLYPITTVEQFQELLTSDLFKLEPHYVLGAGSNTLFTKDYDGIIVKVDLKGIAVEDENDRLLKVKAMAGENWHSFVQYAVNNNWGGVENLSLIPGTMGAAPIQNIGAYGVEIKNVIDKVETIDLQTGGVRVFTNEECEFEYRESVFKRGLQKKYFISSVTLTLTKKNHVLNMHYGSLHERLMRMNVKDINIQIIRDAVIQIRQSKLPDPTVAGNAGSFFKNPTISIGHHEKLKNEYPSMPSYPIDNQQFKLPAGWLIEQCGWRGKRINKIGVHPDQALVLVNYGGGTGEEIFNFSKKIQRSVEDKFQILLTPEVNIL